MLLSSSHQLNATFWQDIFMRYAEKIEILLKHGMQVAMYIGQTEFIA